MIGQFRRSNNISEIIYRLTYTYEIQINQNTRNCQDLLNIIANKWQKLPAK